VETKTPDLKLLSSKRKDSTQLNMSIELPYRAGDIATIIPSNKKCVVDKFLSCLPKSVSSLADIPLSISTEIMSSTQYRTNYTPWPQHCTLRGLLTYCADISNLPEREDLRSLSTYCNPLHPMGIDQWKKLISLSEISDAALYGDYVLREKRNWADVLFDFDSIAYEDNMGVGGHEGRQCTPLTIEHLLMILSPLKPRHFSIASAPSSSVINGHEKGYYQKAGSYGFDLELCVSVVRGTTRHGRKYQGLCSNYLSQLSPHSKSRIWIRPGSFSKLPLDIDMNKEAHIPRFQTPIMCIGAGTGIAPLRSLMHEREAVRKQILQMSKDETSIKITDGEFSIDNILIFGCRKQIADYYYKDEWDSYSSQNRIKILTAFSQEQKRKIYVQHIVRDTDEGIFVAKHILENGGAIYIAGGAKMAKAVKDEIIVCLSKHLPNGGSDAKKLLSKLQRTGMLSIEAWN